jgi:hypothetical protein
MTRRVMASKTGTGSEVLSRTRPQFRGQKPLIVKRKPVTILYPTRLKGLPRNRRGE